MTSNPYSPQKASAFVCACLLLFLGAAITGNAQTNFYSKSTGALNLLSTWGTNTDGSGTQPPNWTNNNQYFNVRNNPSPTINANWSVGGAGSKVIVGDGTNPCNLQLPSNYSANIYVFVSANGTLSNANTVTPAIGTLATNSTVVFNGSSNQNIPLYTYYNLTYAGSAYGTMVAGGCNINGTLSVTNGTLRMDNYTTAYTYNVGNINVTTSGLLDLGSYGGGGNPQPATINLSGNLSQTGAGQIYCTSVGCPNGIINFSGTTTQNIQQASSDFVNYNILSGSTCVLTDDFNFDGTTTQNNYKAYFTINSGGTLDCSTYTVYGYSIDNRSNDYSQLILNSGGTLITANPVGLWDASASNGSVQTQYTTYSSGANLIYDGTSAQTSGVFTTTPTTRTLNNLTINNAAGVTMSQALSLNGNLSLTLGLLNTTTSNLLTINNNGTTSGASNSSFVVGPIKKIGNQAFKFPVGAPSSRYVPIGISAPLLSTDAFQAQYMRASAKALGPITAFGLHHVSACDYWILNRTNGSSPVSVTGYWSPSNNCGNGIYINNMATVALAHFNTSSNTWDAWGNNGGVTGNITSGSVTWLAVTNFSPFSLASTDILNPLPLTLVDFTAAWNENGTVDLNWQTADEQNLHHYAIERSPEGSNWQEIGQVLATGSVTTTNSYTFNDHSPLSGTSYYRLKIVNQDGNYAYSGIKTVSSNQKSRIRIYPNPASDHINVVLPTGGPAGPASILLMSMEGRVLAQKELNSQGGETIQIPTSLYPQGIYMIQVISSGSSRQTGTVIIKRN